MKSSTIVIFSFVCSFVPLCLSQQRSESSYDRVARSVLACDGDVMREVVKRNDVGLIPTLSQRLQEPRDEEAKRCGELTLAKLGDVHTLQDIFCQVDKVAGIDPVLRRKLEYIGGGFSVLTLATIIDRDPEYEKIVKKNKLWKPGDDSLLGSPSDIALDLLPRLVPDGPKTESATVLGTPERRSQISAWRHWIEDHKDEIRTLQPYGTGVVFSSTACGKSVAKHRE